MIDLYAELKALLQALVVAGIPSALCGGLALRKEETSKSVGEFEGSVGRGLEGEEWKGFAAGRVERLTGRTQDAEE